VVRSLRMSILSAPELPFDEPETVAEAMKRMPGINGFYGATSMERLPVERGIKEQVSKFKGMKLAG
jgi:predicted TIM-barrel enzyme